jgi:hypothetical protein
LIQNKKRDGERWRNREKKRKKKKKKSWTDGEIERRDREMESWRKGKREIVGPSCSMMMVMMM